MKRGTHPNSLANIKPPKKGEIRNPKGKPKQLKTILKELGYAYEKLSAEDKERVVMMLRSSIMFGSIADARKVLKDKSFEGEKFGMVMELALRQVCGHNSWQGLKDIIDYLFGKPKQTVDNNVNASVTADRPQIIFKDTTIETK